MNSQNFTQDAIGEQLGDQRGQPGHSEHPLHPAALHAVSGTTTDLTLNASPPNYCWGTGGFAGLQHERLLHAPSGTRPTPTPGRSPSPPARMSQTAPVTGRASWTAAQSTCPQNPFLQAIVTFDDYPIGRQRPSQVQCGDLLRKLADRQRLELEADVPGHQRGRPERDLRRRLSRSPSRDRVHSGRDGKLRRHEPAGTGDQHHRRSRSCRHERQRERQRPTITASSPSVTTLANYYITVTTPGGSTEPGDCPSAMFVVHAAIAPPSTSVTPNSGLHHARNRDHDQRKRLHQRRHCHHGPGQRRIAVEPANSCAPWSQVSSNTAITASDLPVHDSWVSRSTSW